MAKVKSFRRKKRTTVQVREPDFFTRVWQFFTSLYTVLVTWLWGDSVEDKRIDIPRPARQWPLKDVPRKDVPRSSLSTIQQRLSPDERLVNNPGKGHCMYYALALDLIVIVQQQARNQDQTLFNRWQALTPSLCYEQLLAFDTRSPLKAGKTLWDELQRSLRALLATVRMNKLDQLAERVNSGVDSDELLIQNPLYRQFCELCNPGFKNTRKDNLLAGTHLGLTQEINALRRLPPSADKDARIEQLFTGLLSQDSSLRRLIRAQVTSNTWGTLEELTELAEVLEVNLDVRNNLYRDPNPSRVTLASYLPTVSLFNCDGVHWQSILSTTNLALGS